MKHLLILGALGIAATVIGPVTALADDHHREKRYYDKVHRDYHYWNDGEDRQYRAYLVERHEAYVPFVQYRHRQEYFKYHHEHGFTVGIR